jgi:peptidoglycan-associated lipoprotein
VNGTCQQCRGAADCKSGQACNKGRCEEAKIACTDDAQCPADQSCIDGQCRACAADDQCGAGGKCHGGRCQRAPATSSAPLPAVTAAACTLESVFFDFNESVLSTEATSAIEKDAECMKSSPSRTVTLTGRTDPRGTEEYNLALSDKRANSVKDRLSRIGVDSGRLRTVPRGELDATGNDETGWSKDRRVDFQW